MWREVKEGIIKEMTLKWPKEKCNEKGEKAIPSSVRVMCQSREKENIYYLGKRKLFSVVRK